MAKVYDWTLYVDVLAGQDPDSIDCVTFDMRDDSFVTTAFTCYCPPVEDDAALPRVVDA